MADTSYVNLTSPYLLFACCFRTFGAVCGQEVFLFPVSIVPVCQVLAEDRRCYKEYKTTVRTFDK